VKLFQVGRLLDTQGIASGLVPELNGLAHPANHRAVANFNLSH
jgi:hypothetical protein